MTTTLAKKTPGPIVVCVTLAVAGLAVSAQAQTYSASDSVFAPGTWTWSQTGTNPASTGSATQAIDGFAAGVNAWTSTTTPNGSENTWTVSIFEGFSYDPSTASGPPAGVVVSFDSRWITNKLSGIGPALRQGSNIWAGIQPVGPTRHNTASWASYSYSGWDAMLAGSPSTATLDFSAGAAPIFFGFYQRNAGTGPNQSQFANFSVIVTVPAPAALALVGIAMPLTRRRTRSR